LTVDPLYLATAVEAALAAGRIQKQYFRQPLEIGKKGPIDLVTAADLEVERMFRALVAERFPSHVVIGEEGTSSVPPGPARYRWIIDPVDGTTNFAHGLALFSVSIALEIDGRLEVGVIYDPMADELFTAERGGGARLNGRPIRVSSNSAIIDALLCTGFPYSVHQERQQHVDVFAEFLRQAQAVRRLGSAALDLAYVAAGRFDGFWEERLHPWDIAAGVVIVAEAGGRTTGIDGNEIDVFGGHVIATNGRLHEAVLSVVQRVRGMRPGELHG